jgi:O-antigen/teichoic acid export membrane protein
MLVQIKHLLKHSFIYSISNASLKASGIVLLPLYTSHFTVEEYGTLGLLLITIVLMSQSLILGQGLSLIRYNNSEIFKPNRNSIFFTLTVLVFIIILVFVAISNIYIVELSSLFGDSIVYRLYLSIAILIAAAVTINNLFLSKLRADESSILYTVSIVIKILIMIGVNYYLILHEKMGIEAVLYALLAGEVSITLIIIPRMISLMTFRLEFTIIKETLEFGFPLIFSTMAINLLNGSDRFLIKYLGNETELGLYELGYKIAGIVSMFIILPFGMTLMPIAYKMFKKEGDKHYYSKLKTYSSFIFIWMGLAISIFSEDIVKLFALNSSFYSAYTVVPLIVLAYVIYGVSMISALGMYLTGKSHLIAYITIFCAALNIGLNFWLIPEYGMMGAAVNTVISFAILDIFTNIASNNYYTIPYEHLKVIKIFILGLCLFAISTFIDIDMLVGEFAFKFSLIVVFPFLTLSIKYFTNVEIEAINNGLIKWRNPLKWKQRLLKIFSGDE